MSRKYLFLAALGTAAWFGGSEQAGAVPVSAPAGNANVNFAEAQELLITAADPADAVVTGDEFNGVATLLIPGVGTCTATLVNPFQAVTAAHCFGDPVGDGTTTGLTTNGVSLFFGDVVFDGGTFFFEEQISAKQVDINPLWLGPTGGTNPDGTADVFGDGDIAIVTLAGKAVGYEFYDLLLEETFDELFQPHIRVGRGTAGPLGDGDDRFGDFQRRIGANEYDLFLSNFGLPADTLVPGSRLLYDCDDGTTENNSFQSFSTAAPGETFGPGSLGLGDLEACAGPGDSGSGNFIVDAATGDFIIAGVTSFGSVNQVFGGFGGDTRTAAHADFLNSVLLPLPSPAVLLLAGLAGLGILRRRKA